MLLISIFPVITVEDALTRKIPELLKLLVLLDTVVEVEVFNLMPKEFKLTVLLEIVLEPEESRDIP